jgi:hypothetical protein
MDLDNLQFIRAMSNLLLLQQAISLVSMLIIYRA